MRIGTRSPAKFGRFEFVARFSFGKMCLGKKYATKQVHAIAAPQGTDDWLIVTVIVKLLNANEQLSADRRKAIVVENEASGESAEIALAVPLP